MAYEIDDLIKCTQCEAHFILTHFKAHNPFNGLSTLRLEPKQLTILNKIINKQIIFDSIPERQIGTSTILAAHALWLATFKPNQRIIFMNPNHNQASNVRFIIKEAHDNLPDFLQCKMLTDHKQSMEFENGSWIHFINSDVDHLRGVNTTCIIADTFDYFDEKRQNELRQHAWQQGMHSLELLKV